MMRGLLPCAVVLGVTTASSVRADEVSPEERAAAHVAAAETHASAGDLLLAAAEYREAFEQVPDVKYLCNVGVAYYRAPDFARAQIYLAECAVRGSALDAAFVSSVRRTLDTVDAKLRAGDFTPVEIQVEPPNAVVTFDAFAAGESFIGTRVFWLPFGTHAVTVSAEGFTSQTQTIQARARTSQSARVELVRRPVPGPGGDVPPPPPASPPSVPPVRSSAPAPAAPSAVPAIIATASSGVVGGLAIGVYVSARALGKQVDPSGPRSEYDQQVDRARSRQHLAWGLGAAAGVGAIASAYLWYKRSTAAIEVTPTAGGAAVSFSGSW